MNAALQDLVWRRAGGLCEYCRMPQTLDELPFQIDHVVARKHRGATAAANLALSCYHCNAYKGPNVGGLDPSSEKLTSVFNPRRHRWETHFRWNGPHLIGRTAIGRTTIDVLKINHRDRVELRQELIDDDRFPPPPM